MAGKMQDAGRLISSVAAMMLLLSVPSLARGLRVAFVGDPQVDNLVEAPALNVSPATSKTDLP